MGQGIPGLRSKEFQNNTELDTIPYDLLENNLTVIGRFKHMNGGNDSGYETVAVIPHPDKSQDPIIVVVSDHISMPVMLTTRTQIAGRLEGPDAMIVPAHCHASRMTLHLYDQYLLALHDEMSLECN